MRWALGDEGGSHAVTGKQIHFPDDASLEVERLVISKDGQVVDFAGMVTANPKPW